MNALTFETDNQTLIDLNIFSSVRGHKSIYEFYDRTQTNGGKNALMAMFYTPLNGPQVADRTDTIKILCENDINFEFDYLQLDFIEHYLTESMPILRDNLIDSFVYWIGNKITPDSNHYIISRGVDYLNKLIIQLGTIRESLTGKSISDFLKQFDEDLTIILEKTECKVLTQPKSKLSFFRRLSQSDRVIRKKEKESVTKILQYVYMLDAFLSTALMAKQKSLCFAKFVDTSRPSVNIKGFYHPLLGKPTSSDILVEYENNLCFLTGPNMTGKSTFLKSVGLCIYLSHLGFPVPAKSMETSVFNGLYSTINLSDNINRGYSHYYSEVRRVKDIVLRIKEKRRVFVIFDELFKGTNVKDAYDATLMITTAFSKIKDCIFFISTHIVEVGEEILKQNNNVLFKCLESSLNGEEPVYTYKLLNGISSERLGLLIIRKEKIMDMIEDIIQNDGR